MKPSDAPAAICEMGRPEVLLETILPGLRRRSMRVTSSRLGASSSTIASTIQSPSLIHPSCSSRLPTLTRSAVALVKNAGGFDFFIRSSDAATMACVMSSR